MTAGSRMVARAGLPPNGGSGGRCGQALTEYLAVIAVLLAVVAVLTAVTPRRAGRIPINPLLHLRALVVPPPRPRPVVTAPRPRLVTPPRRTTPRRRVERAVILVPIWSVGP